MNRVCWCFISICLFHVFLSVYYSGLLCEPFVLVFYFYFYLFIPCFLFVYYSGLLCESCVLVFYFYLYLFIPCFSICLLQWTAV